MYIILSKQIVSFFSPNPWIFIISEHTDQLSFCPEMAAVIKSLTKQSAHA